MISHYIQGKNSFPPQPNNILAFQSSSHILFLRNERWLPCVIKYSTSQQCFIKKQVHEFLKLFCKSLWKLTMKANTFAGVQVPGYHHAQPDARFRGEPLPTIVSETLFCSWREHHPYSTAIHVCCSGTQGSSVTRGWFEGHTRGRICLWNRAMGWTVLLGSYFLAESPKKNQAGRSGFVFQYPWLPLLLERNW